VANIQMIPPGNGSQNPCRFNGRSYAAALGTALSVPDFDAAVLESNGWVRCAAHGSGTTAQRPAPVLLFRGFTYFDSTVGANVIWDGLAWRHHATGAGA
jgi:hypothetical protein